MTEEGDSNEFEIVLDIVKKLTDKQLNELNDYIAILLLDMT